ncbi:alpha/beta hydrolase [Roseomonas sp. WA12]
MQAFLDDCILSGKPMLHDLPVAEARQELTRLQAIGASASPVAVQFLQVEVPGRPAVCLRILRPLYAEGSYPFVLYLHGGAWVAGDATSYARLVSELTNSLPAAIVFVEYSLAPEALFPVQVEEAYAALLHVVAEADALGLDSSRIVVAGDCAGGSMAAAIALMAKQRRGPEIVFQLLICPLIDEPSPAPGEEPTPWLTRSALRNRLRLAFPQQVSRGQITAFPLKANLAELNDLPEALVIVAEHDIMRAPAEHFALRLAEAGVAVTCTRYNGVIHDFLLLNALAHTAPARSAMAQISGSLRAALYQG